MKDESDNSKTCAWLAYLLIGIIWYYSDEKMRKNSYVKFHVKQAIILIIFSIAWAIVMAILRSIFFFSALGFWTLWPIFLILSYVPLIFCIVGIINAINTKEKNLPVIGSFAKNLTF